LKENFLH